MPVRELLLLIDLIVILVTGMELAYKFEFALLKTLLHQQKRGRGGMLGKTGGYVIKLRKTLWEIVLLLGCASAFTQTAHATTINFDDVADGTVIDSHYAGVTFSNPLGGSIYARGSVIAETSPNVVSVFATGFPEFDVRHGAVEAVFAALQSLVSIDASPVRSFEPLDGSANRPFIEFFDSSNKLLDEEKWSGTLPDTGNGPYETLSYDAGSALIAYVIFSSQHPVGSEPVYGAFDNLTFGAATAVPEPGTLILLATGVAGLLAFGRRKALGFAGPPAE
jgi:hypothetical protein